MHGVRSRARLANCAEPWLYANLDSQNAGKGVPSERQARCAFAPRIADTIGSNLETDFSIRLAEHGLSASVRKVAPKRQDEDQHDP